MPRLLRCCRRRCGAAVPRHFPDLARRLLHTGRALGALLGGTIFVTTCVVGVVRVTAEGFGPLARPVLRACSCCCRASDKEGEEETPTSSSMTRQTLNAVVHWEGKTHMTRQAQC